MGGHVWITEMMDDHEIWSYWTFRMHLDTLKSFVQLLEIHGGLRETIHMTTIEQVCIFLYAFDRAVPNRDLQERFQHSGEIISHHIISVLDTILCIEPMIIHPPPNHTADYISSNHKHYPYFEVSPL
jgi:hypothetical protein